MLRGIPGSLLHGRLDQAVFDPASFSSVAGISLQPHRASRQSECCIGDALTMIPPVTGNGMSMAFESARLAAEPLAAYSRAEISWTEARARTASACDAAFTRRLAWAKWLQWMLFLPALQSGPGMFLLRSEWLWRILFSRTR
jgi:flavin-dependent dehydrogenase